jgi:hypothetical protein
MRRQTALAHAWLLLFVVACGDDAAGDEDLIERFLDDLAGPVDEGYVERSLGYTDMNRFPIDVRVPHHSGVYDDASSAKLIKAYRDVMRRRFYGSEIKLRGRRVEIADDRAEVRFGMVTTVGLLRAEVALRKAGPTSWKLTKVHIDR